MARRLAIAYTAGQPHAAQATLTIVWPSPWLSTFASNAAEPHRQRTGVASFEVGAETVRQCGPSCPAG